MIPLAVPIAFAVLSACRLAIRCARSTGVDARARRAYEATLNETVHFESISFLVQAQGFMVLFLPFGSEMQTYCPCVACTRTRPADSPMQL
jgi:hypothetical protein